MNCEKSESASVVNHIILSMYLELSDDKKVLMGGFANVSSPCGQLFRAHKEMK